MSAAFYNNWIEERDPVHAGQAVSTPRRIRRRTGRCRPSSSRAWRSRAASCRRRFTYLNFGKSTQPGARARRERPRQRLRHVFVNYSWQAEPDPEDFLSSELNLPPTNRFNAGVSFTYGRFLGNLSVSYSDDSASGRTCSPIRTTARPRPTRWSTRGFGCRWLDDKFTTSIKAVNLGNDDRPAARLRRHHEAPDHGGGAGALPGTVGFSCGQGSGMQGQASDS